MAEVVEVQLDYRGKPRSQYQTVNDEPSKTVQSDAHRADIREILKKYDQVGIVDHLAKVDAQFMDVTAFNDYADLMRHVQTAESQFMELPSKIREMFDHDVAKWLDAAHDQEKLDEVVEALAPKEAPAGDAGAGEGGVGETPPVEGD